MYKVKAYLNIFYDIPVHRPPQVFVGVLVSKHNAPICISGQNQHLSENIKQKIVTKSSKNGQKTRQKCIKEWSKIVKNRFLQGFLCQCTMRSFVWLGRINIFLKSENLISKQFLVVHALFIFLLSFSFFTTSKYEMYLSNIYHIYKYVVWDVGKYNFLSKIVVELPLRKTFANWAEGLKFTNNLRSLKPNLFEKCTFINLLCTGTF